MLFCNSFIPKCGPNWYYHGYQTDKDKILKLGSFCNALPKHLFKKKKSVALKVWKCS